MEDDLRAVKTQQNVSHGQAGGQSGALWIAKTKENSLAHVSVARRGQALASRAPIRTQAGMGDTGLRRDGVAWSEPVGQRLRQDEPGLCRDRPSRRTRDGADRLDLLQVIETDVLESTDADNGGAPSKDTGEAIRQSNRVAVRRLRRAPSEIVRASFTPNRSPIPESTREFLLARVTRSAWQVR